MTKLQNLKKKWLKDPTVRAEYEALADEFTIAEALIHARMQAGMTQYDVAKKMETSQSYIAKLEGGANPSLKALKRYAEATGSQLKISLEPLS